MDVTLWVGSLKIPLDSESIKILTILIRILCLAKQKEHRITLLGNKQIIRVFVIVNLDNYNVVDGVYV